MKTPLFNLTKSSTLLVALALVSACNDKAKAPNANPAAPDQIKPQESADPARQTLEQIRTSDNFLVKADFAAGELLKVCDVAISDAQARVDALGKLPVDQQTFATTTFELENLLVALDRDTNRMGFLSEVAIESALRDEANDCSTHASTFYVNLFTRRDVYNALKNAKPTNVEEERLQKSYMESFESNGLKLGDDVLAQVNAKSQELAVLTNDFSNNIDEDTTTVTLTQAELQGVPDSVIKKFKDADGNYVIPMNEAIYPQVVINATVAETRHKCSLAYNNRAAGPNLPLLKKILKLRQEIAALQGYPSWADYQLSSGRMAKDVPTVMNFLNGLKDKLAVGLQRDYDGLLKYKKEVIDPKADHLDPWDLGYIEYQLQKRDYQLDDEKIREYFPADKVIEGMFKVYSTLLSVRFEKVADAAVWAPGVEMYKIIDAKSSELIGHFYTDFYPRKGKFSHAAAFQLTAGRRLADGNYNKPMSAIVANLNPPEDGKPSLFAHDEVETIFHEFGHIMHQTLTKAPYASLAGSAVYRDFVEAPSQMLENWVWSPEILANLSSNFQTGEHLPADLLKQMIAARDFDKSRAYTGQLYYALMDMKYHTLPGDFDTTEVQQQLYRDVLKLEPTAGSHFEASFGHLMGYDAGYYGYLWSQVYAADMFTRFQAEGLLNPDTGASYRSNILERGGMEDPLMLLTKFLGREPNNKAFLERLGIE